MEQNLCWWWQSMWPIINLNVINAMKCTITHVVLTWQISGDEFHDNKLHITDRGTTLKKRSLTQITIQAFLCLYKCIWVHGKYNNDDTITNRSCRSKIMLHYVWIRKMGMDAIIELSLARKHLCRHRHRFNKVHIILQVSK